VGIILQGDKFWAIIKTPDKRIYKATIGMQVGPNKGYITKITKERVDILERKDVVEGDWIEHTASLRLVDTKSDQ
jgi:Tfp pilus assembly protein PilP